MLDLTTTYVGQYLKFENKNGGVVWYGQVIYVNSEELCYRTLRPMSHYNEEYILDELNPGWKLTLLYIDDVEFKLSIHD